jgi:gamma-glutamyl hercynylcysteine S-oxide synthase
MDERRTQLARMLEETRAETLALFRMAREEDLHESPGFGFRPVLWHLAHIGVFEAYWLLQKLGGEPAPDERYERVFDPIATPREESKNLPSRPEMEAYLSLVRGRALRRLEASNFDTGQDPLLRGGYVFDLVLEHERQHQETLAYLLRMLDPSKKTRPETSNLTDAAPSFAATSTGTAGEIVTVAGGPFEMGAVWDSFAYDNERPARTVSLRAFRIARLPVTNDEYARFVAVGGYERREFWSDEGWARREEEGWSCPLFWRRCEGEGGWDVQGMFETGALEGSHPVTGVSWHEAEAYARFAGKRLPTEAEWEKAASWDERAGRKRRYAWGDEEPDASLCNFGSRLWGTTPVGSFPEGASAYGCLDMTGNVWEWTADPFQGFPGFEPFPYPEYSQEWFDGDHRVLKGGSWATRASVLRTSFRNFFRRHFRIAFAGIRLAEDA